MRLLAGLLVLALAPAYADEQARRVKAEQMFEALNMKQNLEQSFNAISSMMMAQAPKDAQASEIGPKMMALIKAKLTWESLKDEFVKIYADAFTDEELDAIIGFYHSPAGKSMLTKMPMLMQKGMQIAQGRMMEIKPEIDKLVEDAMEKARAGK